MSASSRVGGGNDWPHAQLQGTGVVVAAVVAGGPLGGGEPVQVRALPPDGPPAQAIDRRLARPVALVEAGEHQVEAGQHMGRAGQQQQASGQQQGLGRAGQAGEGGQHPSPAPRHGEVDGAARDDEQHQGEERADDEPPAEERLQQPLLEQSR
jgi:hypothetical protein